MKCNYCTNIATHYFQKNNETWYHWHIDVKGSTIDDEPSIMEDMNEIPEFDMIYTCDIHSEKMGAAIDWAEDEMLDF